MSEIRVDTISEKTSANGVTIDGLTIKDGKIQNLMNTTLNASDLGAGLHIKTGDSGGSANANADELILEGTGSGSGVGMGILAATNGFGYIVFGDSGGNAQGGIQYHNNGDSMRIYTNDSERVRIDSSGNFGVNNTSPARQVHITNTIANSGASLGLTSSDSSTSGSFGIIHFGNNTDSSLASIGGFADGATDAGALVFKTEATGGAIEERVRFSSSEAVFNEGSFDIDFRVESNGATHMLFVDGGNDVVIVGGKDGSGTVPAPKNAAGGLDPVFQLQGANNANQYSMHISAGINSAGSPPRLIMSKSRDNTLNGNTILQTDDAVGAITFCAADGTDRNSVVAEIIANVDASPGSNDTPGRLSFLTTADGSNSTTERVRIHNNGVASFNNGIALGVGTANTASNVLDDYEEGTYTPTVDDENGGSYGLSSGGDTLQYTKIGRKVTLQGMLSVTSESSPNGTLRLSLPFTAPSLVDDTDYALYAMGLSNNGSTIAGQKFLFVQPGSYAFLYALGDDGSSNYIGHDEVDTNFQFHVNLSYVVS